MPNVIAVDGPAGSGKSTVAKEVAKRLKFLYIDTGAMYRALTLKAIETRVDFKDEKALVGLSENTDIELRDSEGSLKVYLDKKDVSREIRTMDVTKRVKNLAALKDVRINMVKLQRKMGEATPGAVLEGRDIGTVVFPDAAYKFYLDASFKTRVQRRFDELKEKGMNTPWKEVEDDLRDRDRADMTRAVGPLKKAPDSIVVDTTKMTIEDAVSEILNTVGAKL
ncbi:(d)CMP kinase [Candidatus Omnitrophota bacterium]